jgi:hypothetical protein
VRCEKCTPRYEAWRKGFGRRSSLASEAAGLINAGGEEALRLYGRGGTIRGASCNVDEREEVVREQMKARLETLKSELEAGETELARVEQRRAFLRETMLRIGGAVQVLEELLAQGHPDGRPTVQRNSTDPGASPEQSGTHLSGVRAEEDAREF